MVMPYAPPTPQLPGMMPMGGGMPMTPVTQGVMGPPTDIIEADYQLLVAREEANLAAKPPPWYVPYPAPDPKTIEGEATEQKHKHEQRVLNAAWMQLRLGMEISAIFLSDEAWVKLKVIEPQPSPLLRLIHDAIVNFVAQQNVIYTSLATGLTMREERAAIEGHLADTIRDWRQRHFREGQGSLLRTLTADALSGMVAVYHAPDPSNERTGQRLYRVDPKTVYPVFGRDGLDRVYCVYDAAYPEVMRDFGDGVDPETGRPNPATREIQRIARKGQGSGNKRIDTETFHPVVCYYDRERTMVLWKGEVVRDYEHKLWVCPWHVGVPNWRQTAGTKDGYSSLDLGVGGGNRAGPVDSQGRSLIPGAHAPERDLERMFEPFLRPWVPVVDKVEKVQTRLGYGLDRLLSNPLVWKRASSNSAAGAPELQNYPNGVTEIEEDEELDVLPMNPPGEMFEPWMQLMTLELQAAIPSVILQGQTIGTQASGNALDVINEMGLQIFSPVPEFMQMFLNEVGHRDLLYRKEWAGAFDELAVPLGGGYGNQEVVLGKELLERAGCYVDCTLKKFTLAGAVPAITAAAAMKTQLGVGDDRFYLELLGATSDIEGTIKARQHQDMRQSPGFIEADQIENLYDEMLRAEQMGDTESLRRIQIFARRVAQKQAMHDMQIAKMIGMLSPQPSPMAGELPGNAGQPGGATMPYMSAPEVGAEVGHQGGAPQQVPMPGMG